jgi:hypothetical protein
MPQLPFVQAPEAPTNRRLGTPASGILEMPVLGGLTVGESAVISELLANEQSSFVKGAQIADAIAKAEQISISEAFNIIEGAISGRQLEERAEEIRTKHAALIQEVAQVYASAGQRNMESTVTALIRCRCALPDWSVADTRQMHRALFNAIWQLAQEESDAEAMPSEPPTEEELGKPPAADGAAAKRTGRRSSTT